MLFQTFKIKRLKLSLKIIMKVMYQQCTVLKEILNPKILKSEIKMHQQYEIK